MAARADAYRARVERQMIEMGYRAGTYQWQRSPSRLTVVVAGNIREFELHAGQSKGRTERELGRLEAFAEVYGLHTRQKPEPKRKQKPVKRDVMQLDLVDMVNGSAHAIG